MRLFCFIGLMLSMVTIRAAKLGSNPHENPTQPKEVLIFMGADGPEGRVSLIESGFVVESNRRNPKQFAMRNQQPRLQIATPLRRNQQANENQNFNRNKEFNQNHKFNRNEKMIQDQQHNQNQQFNQNQRFNHDANFNQNLQYSQNPKFNQNKAFQKEPKLTNSEFTSQIQRRPAVDQIYHQGEKINTKPEHNFPHLPEGFISSHKVDRNIGHGEKLENDFEQSNTFRHQSNQFEKQPTRNEFPSRIENMNPLTNGDFANSGSIRDKQESLSRDFRTSDNLINHVNQKVNAPRTEFSSNKIYTKDEIFNTSPGNNLDLSPPFHGEEINKLDNFDPPKSKNGFLYMDDIQQNQPNFPLENINNLPTSQLNKEPERSFYMTENVFNKIKTHAEEQEISMRELFKDKEYINELINDSEIFEVPVQHKEMEKNSKYNSPNADTQNMNSFKDVHASYKIISDNNVFSGISNKFNNVNSLEGNNFATSNQKLPNNPSLTNVSPFMYNNPIDSRVNTVPRRDSSNTQNTLSMPSRFNKKGDQILNNFLRGDLMLPKPIHKFKAQGNGHINTQNERENRPNQNRLPNMNNSKNDFIQENRFKPGNNERESNYERTKLPNIHNGHQMRGNKNLPDFKDKEGTEKLSLRNAVLLNSKDAQEGGLGFAIAEVLSKITTSLSRKNDFGALQSSSNTVSPDTPNDQSRNHNFNHHQDEQIDVRARLMRPMTRETFATPSEELFRQDIPVLDSPRLRQRERANYGNADPDVSTW